MALTQRIKQGFLRLPFSKKAVLLSSAALMISAVLPWYDNRNSFGVGDTYLGIEGPLFLVGALVLAFGAISFFNMFFPLMGRNFFRLKRKSGVTAMLLGIQSLLLIVVANSVFYHPSFGMNVSHKGARFGMLFAFASISVMVISGWMTHRREKAGKFDEIDADELMQNPVGAGIARPVASPIASPIASPDTEIFEPGATYSSGYQRPTGAYSGNGVTGSVGLENGSRRSTVSSTAGSTVGSTENPGGGVDPLTLDAKTRYKMLRAQQRRSESAKTNLWGNGSDGDNGSYGSTTGDGVRDNMKIRMDL
jgi:hypothetical protein